MFSLTTDQEHVGDALETLKTQNEAFMVTLGTAVFAASIPLAAVASEREWEPKTGSTLLTLGLLGSIILVLSVFLFILVAILRSVAERYIRRFRPVLDNNAWLSVISRGGVLSFWFWRHAVRFVWASIVFYGLCYLGIGIALLLQANIAIEHNVRLRSSLGVSAAFIGTFLGCGWLVLLIMREASLGGYISSPRDIQSMDQSRTTPMQTYGGERHVVHTEHEEAALQVLEPERFDADEPRVGDGSQHLDDDIPRGLGNTSRMEFAFSRISGGGDVSSYNTAILHPRLKEDALTNRFSGARRFVHTVAESSIKESSQGIIDATAGPMMCADCGYFCFYEDGLSRHGQDRSKRGCRRKEGPADIVYWDRDREVWVGFDGGRRINFTLQQQRDLQRKAGYDEDWINNSRVAFEHWQASMDID